MVLLSTPDNLSLVSCGHSFVFSGRAVAPADDLQAGTALVEARSEIESQKVMLPATSPLRLPGPVRPA
jgi:hypothetical protein